MKEQTFNTGNVGRDAVGIGATGVVASEIKGNVIQLVINSPEVAERMGLLQKMPTEVAQTQAAGMEGNTTTQNSEELQESINQLLGVIHTIKKSGKDVKEISANNIQLSQVELLLKKAILLKSDADQMYFDHIARKKTGGYPLQGGYSTDLSELLSGFNEKAHHAKLQEAFSLLQEANSLDPSNTEVLLHMAKLLIELTPDDPSDEQRLLRRIQNLLNAPKDKAEEFRLAQATFLLGTTSEPMHIQLLKDARRMFEKLGREEWVRQCDDLLKTIEPTSPNHQQTKSTPPPPQTFQPEGQWNVQISDYASSTMQINLHHNGYFEATQNTGHFGITVQATGQWFYNPAQQLLQMQGSIGGIQPFMLGIMIHSGQGNVFYATGMDGYAYTFSRI